MMVSNWVWPAVLRNDDSIAVRIGRVLHWGSAGASAIILSIGLFLFLESAYERGQVHLEIDAFDENHATDRQWHIPMPNGAVVIVNAREGTPFDEVLQIAELHADQHQWIRLAQPGRAWHAYQGGDRPIAPNFKYWALWVALLLSGFLLVCGRAFRYILARE